MTDSAKIKAVIGEIVFIPTLQMRRVKADFWTRYGENPISDKNSITITAAMDITNDSRLQKWWSLPGFRDWFTNQDEFRQRVEYLAHMALDCLEELMADRDAQPSARANAAKLILEASNKMPQRYQREKLLDAHIQKMGPRELEAWLERQGVKLISAKPE